MRNQEAVCDREGCDVSYIKKTHNQRYCSDECCRLATNKRIMEKYYARRDQLQGKPRYCKMCGITKLSRYNDGEICAACQTKKFEEANGAVVSMLLNASLIA